MLKVEHVTKFYGDFKAVDDLSFELSPGEIYGLLGVNGAGKTTTFRMIMGLLEPTKGKITFNGEKINYDVTDQIGFLTEERSLLLKLTVKEQCLYYGTLKGMKKEDILNRMNELLTKFNISEYENKKIKELSKGNQQKIQFITAVINKPKLLILDEPFSGLDPFNTEFFKKEIVEMSKEGSMIIFSTHRMEHIELFCKKITILLKGQDVLSGDLSKIKEDYMKKNIVVRGNVNIKELEDLEGVESIDTLGQDIIVRIHDKSYASNIFDKIKNNEITKFVIEEPSLDEIFVAKVGEEFEK